MMLGGLSPRPDGLKRVHLNECLLLGCNLRSIERLGWAQAAVRWYESTIQYGRPICAYCGLRCDYSNFPKAELALRSLAADSAR